MTSERTSRLLLSTFYLFVFLSSAFTHIAGGIVLTTIFVVIVYFYRIPPIPSAALQSRLKSNTGEKGTIGTDVTSRSTERNVILHRAGMLETPENTLEGVRLAYEDGAVGVEVDLEFTADGIGVLLHDSTVDRTTNGSGPIDLMKFEDVRKLDAAAKHPCRSRTGPMQIPSLEECIEECLKLDLMVYIDCKSKPQMTADLLHKLFQKYPDLYRKAVVCSFYPQVIYAVRRKDPDIMTGLTHRERVLSRNVDGTPRNKELWKKVVAPVLDVILMLAHNHWLWFLCGNSFFIIHKDTLSKSVWKYWKSIGITVIPWTVNSPSEKEFFHQVIGCPIMTDGMNTKE